MPLSQCQPQPLVSLQVAPGVSGSKAEAVGGTIWQLNGDDGVAPGESSEQANWTLSKPITEKGGGKKVSISKCNCGSWRLACNGRL